MAIAQLLFPKGNFIDEIELDIIITEDAATSSQITKNPIQNAADSNDHIILQPMAFDVQGAVSNASASSIGQFSQNAFTPRKDRETWEALLELQASKIIFTLVQGLKTYPNVQILSLRESQDKNTYSSLFFTATFQEIIIPGGVGLLNQFGDQDVSDQASTPITGGLKQLSN